MRMTGSRLAAVAALSVASVIACTAEKPEPPKRSPVLIGELRFADAGPGTAIVRQVPDVGDGQQNSNPPGTVELFGPALQIDDNSVQNPCNARAVYSPVAVKNYATEALNNVQIVFEVLSGTDNGLCNTFAGDPLGATTIGRVSYGNLTGSPSTTWTPGVPTIEPGGVATVTWWFRYPVGSTTFSFRAKVYADVDPEPPGTLSPNDAATRLCRPNTVCGASLNQPVLTWSGQQPRAYVQISPSPTFATSVEGAEVIGTGPTNGLYSFTHTMTTPGGNGGLRYWRVFNRWSNDSGATWVTGTLPTSNAVFEAETEPYGLWTEPVMVDTVASFKHYASSPAPLVEFWQWGWGPYTDGNNTGRADQNSYYHGLADAVTPDFWIVNDWHATGNFGDMTHPISAEWPIYWAVCNQWGSMGAAATRGACAVAPPFTGQ